MELFFLSIPLGLIIGLLLRGSVKNIAEANLRHLYLILVAFLIRFLVNSPDAANSLGLQFLIPLFPILNIFSYTLLFLFAFSNIRFVGIKLFTLGTLLNAMPIILNGGKMPFELKEAEKIGMAEMLLKLSRAGSANIPSNRSAVLWQLGDFIVFPGIRFQKLISVGDIVLFVAFTVLIAELMLVNHENGS